MKNEVPEFPRFKSVELGDKQTIQSYIDKFQPESCEYSFVNIYCWREPYNNLWCIYKNRLVIYDSVNQCSFLPIGKEMTPEELVLFSQDMKKAGMGQNVGVVTSSYIESYPELKNSYQIINERDFAEYVYDVDSLCHLKGRKLHKKKNLISQFHRKYPNFNLKLVENNLQHRIARLADEIYNSHERFLPGIENEHIALMEALDNFEALKLEGLILMIGNDLVAFSIFSPLTSDTYDIHFEKSCHQFKGAAQVINQETAKLLKKKCKYINREQDLGIKGLRQVKMSYNPATVFDIHTLIFHQNN